MTGRYAADTSVPAEKSRMEIERTLQKYGASSFVSGYQGTTAAVGFSLNDRQIRFTLEMPDIADDEFTLTPTGRERSEAQAFAEWEKATRQRWRALSLVIKAKLEAIEVGISEFDDEFMSYIVLPDGSTVGEFMRPQIAAAYEVGTPPSMLALGKGK